MTYMAISARMHGRQASDGLNRPSGQDTLTTAVGRPLWWGLSQIGRLVPGRSGIERLGHVGGEVAAGPLPAPALLRDVGGDAGHLRRVGVQARVVAGDPG